jgi:transposase
MAAGKTHRVNMAVTTPSPINTMQLKTILNRIQKQPGFVFDRAQFVEHRNGVRIHVSVRERRGSDPVCPKCCKKCPAYDRQKLRLYQFVPLWAIPVFFLYAPRRGQCPRCGVKVELLPWAQGKSRMTTALTWFLASWAKVLSWKETATRFRVSWQTVYAAVETAVVWGRLHLNLDGVESIGVDELSQSKGQKYLTLVYQIDHECKRLLWIGRDRTATTFASFFDWLGPERCQELKFVTSDMWRAFISTVARKANAAVHVLDRFHVMRLFSDAVDQVRRDEARKLRAQGDTATLKHTRWILLKRKDNLDEPQFCRLRELMKLNYAVTRAYLLKESFQQFWQYKSAGWAGKFLDLWVKDAKWSRLGPFAKLAGTLRDHRDLLLNWFKAREAFAAGAVEGFNLKARVTTRMAYGFRSYDHAETALYHRLGNLPEPDWLTHRFT